MWLLGSTDGRIMVPRAALEALVAAVRERKGVRGWNVVWHGLNNWSRVFFFLLVCFVVSVDCQWVHLTLSRSGELQQDFMPHVCVCVQENSLQHRAVCDWPISQKKRGLEGPLTSVHERVFACVSACVCVCVAAGAQQPASVCAHACPCDYLIVRLRVARGREPLWL